MVRRQDGQTVQLPQLLYLVAERADGRHSYDEIASEVSQAFGRGLEANQVEYLVDEKLRPLGVIAGADGSQPQLQKVDPLLALKLRTAVVPERLVNAITTVFRPLFFTPVVVGILAGLVALDAWLFFYHGVAQSLRQTLYDPAFMLLLLGLVVLSAAFHECGHATACRYGGAKPGVMGVGVYVVWPAFYTDVTDAYRLGKAGRLRTDLGGIYFNVIFILLTAGAYAVTGFEPLLLMIPLQHLEILHQLLPFIRLDGYYIVSDLTGVPDMFSRIKPTLVSLVPGKETHERVAELKSWVRGVVTVYVLTVIPLLLLMFGMMVINAPRIFATAWDSFFVQYHKLGHGSAIGDVMHVIQMLVLVLPVAGIVASFGRVGTRIGSGVWTRTEGKPLARAAAITAAAAAAAFAGYIWWPNGEYRPIQKGEKGTVQGALRQFEHVSSGRPGLTQERQQQLGGAPFRSTTLQSRSQQRQQQQEQQSQSQSPSQSQSQSQSTTEETTTADTTSTTETTTTPAATNQSQTATTPSTGGTTASTPTATTTATDTGPSPTTTTSP